MIKFREKQFNLMSDIISGASIGGVIGTGMGMFRKDADPSKGPIKTDDFSRKEYRDGRFAWKKQAGYAGMGMLIGGMLGAVASGIKQLSKSESTRTTVDQRLMRDIVDILRKDGMREGRQFTRDPKIANDLKTKVCIAVTKNSGDLKILINTIQDSKLKSLVFDTIKNIPNTSAVTKNMTDKFNDITVTCMDNSAGAGLIAGIAEKFIHSGYSVYLVEVG